MMRRHKYNAKKTVVNGIVFDSKAEARRYVELRLMEGASEIFDLELQPTFILQEAFKDKHGKRVRAIKYIGDFAYRELPPRGRGDTVYGVEVIEDVKGIQTAVFKLKRKLFLKKYPWVDLRIVN